LPAEYGGRNLSFSRWGGDRRRRFVRQTCSGLGWALGPGLGRFGRLTQKMLQDRINMRVGDSGKQHGQLNQLAEKRPAQDGSCTTASAGPAIWAEVAPVATGRTKRSLGSTAAAGCARYRSTVCVIPAPSSRATTQIAKSTGDTLHGPTSILAGRRTSCASSGTGSAKTATRSRGDRTRVRRVCCNR
jgi:hypothetical protein